MTAGVEERRVHLVAIRASVDSMRGDGLSADELRELDVIARGDQRRRERRDQRAADLSAIHDYAIEFSRAVRTRERSLVASMGAVGAAVQAWQGPIGYEGIPTGDGRFIEAGALSAADYPMPLRWSPVDWGAHDGAVVVGRIDSMERRPDGTIFARGVIDLGSEMGREAARLIRAKLLGGISMDLDATTTAMRTEQGQRASVVSEARVRAATLVAIPAFEAARIALVDAVEGGPADDNCGCEDPELVELKSGHAPDCDCGEEGPAEFPGIDAMPTLDQLPDITDMKTLRLVPSPFDRPTERNHQ
jgi:hypothetical protein